MNKVFLILAVSFFPWLSEAAELSPRLFSPSVEKFGKVEISLPVDRTYTNPFDFDEVNIQGHFVDPNGKEYVVDGFYYQDYDQSPNPAGWDQVTPKGSPEWRVRFTPMLSGAYTWWITRKDSTGEDTSPKSQITISSESASPGFVRRAPNQTNFQFDDGSAFYPIGMDLAWPVKKGMYDMQRWLPLLKENGINFIRFWVGPLALTLERMKVPEGGMKFASNTGYVDGYLYPELNFRTEHGKNDPYGGLGQIDLANAWRIDSLLDLSQQNGVYDLFCLEATAYFRGMWPINPYNKVNGGMLDKPTDFFTDEKAKAFFKRRVRYEVARYGSDPHLAVWELFNEIDGVHTDKEPFPVQAAYDWQVEMAKYLKQIDPYGRLVTTSFAGEDQHDPLIGAIPEMDYVQSHPYDSPNPPLLISNFATDPKLIALGKPRLIGEYGLDKGAQAKFNGGNTYTDPTGIHLHEAFWAALACPTAGTPMPWYWDNYIERLNLWPLFHGPALFAKDIPWNKETWTPISSFGFHFQTPPKEEGAPVFAIFPVAGGFQPSPSNQPKTFVLTRDGQLNPSKGGPSMFLFGIKGHAALHNPVTFQVECVGTGRFEVDLNGVSVYGGSALEIEVDGNSALKQDFPQIGSVIPGPVSNITHYNGTYGVDLTAGKHSVTVSSMGADWIEVKTYRFAGCVSSDAPPVVALGMTGDPDLAILYVSNRDYNWSLIDHGQQPVPVAPTVMTVPGILAGNYEAELWDTATGTVAQTLTVSATQAGLTIPLPEIKTDLEIKVRKQ